MSVIGRKVMMARFHQGIHMPGAGELGNTLPSQTKRLDLEMTVCEIGLLVKVLGPSFKAELLVPAANVIAMQLLPEAVQPAKK